MIYFDNNATTAVAPEAAEAMRPSLTEFWGNPSSPYRLGQRAAAAVAEARRAVACLIHVEPEEIVFTSGGTEANLSAIYGLLAAVPEKHHVVSTAVEHPSVLQTLKRLTRQGYEITYLPVNQDGLLAPEAVEAALRPDTVLVSVMSANNETGVLFPIAEIASLCRSRGVWMHTDAVQAAGKIDLDVSATGVHLASFSGHKLHAPKGVGAMYVRSGTPLHPWFAGGSQENRRRSGTENVPGIVGFGVAANLAAQRMKWDEPQIRALRDAMERRLLDAIPGAMRLGHPVHRLPNTCALCFPGIEAEAAILQLDRLGICVSSGSACTTGSLEPSHVLTAMGLAPDLARGALRFSLSRYNTEAEVDVLAAKLPEVVDILHSASL